jgi:hypothetical protein
MGFGSGRFEDEEYFEAESFRLLECGPEGGDGDGDEDGRCWNYGHCGPCQQSGAASCLPRAELSAVMWVEITWVATGVSWSVN